jgi:polyisoprenoid-binding protein YceI
MKIISLVILLLSVFLTACEDPAANKPKATTSDPSTNKPVNVANTNNAANTGTATSAKSEGLSITPENSEVTFVGSKVTGKHDGGFKAITGTIDLVNGKAEESRVSVDIDANSVFADDPGLTKHLKSPDFFDVAKFPKASFKSTKIEAGAQTPDTHTVTGDLELHGQTKSITFPATITVAEDSVTVKADFSISRKNFGIVYTGPADNLIRDDVVLKLNVKAARKK